MTHARVKKILEKNGRKYSDAEVIALRDDENAVRYLQSRYNLEEEEAEKMLRSIDSYCEVVLSQLI